jgi:hypothetical protein
VAGHSGDSKTGPAQARTGPPDGSTPSWWPWLGTAKAAGAAGLLAGLLVPAIGVLAGICLVLYFTGAVITVIRARWYSHIPYPLMCMAPVAGALVLGFAI